MLVGPAEAGAEHEERQRAHTHDEDRVADHAQPAQGLEDGELQEVGAACVPQAVLDAGSGLGDADGQQRQQHHQRQADVHAPEGQLQAGSPASSEREALGGSENSVSRIFVEECGQFNYSPTAVGLVLGAGGGIFRA